MSIIQNIENIQSELSVTETKLANYILDNFLDVPQMTAQNLASLSGTSPATVIRFSKKMGYKKYSDFKLAVSRTRETQIKNEYSNISFDESFEITKNKLLANDKLVIDAIAELLDEETVKKVVNKLYHANKIFVYGVGTSGIAAEDIRQKWLKIGKNVIFEKDKTLILQQMQSDKEKENVFWGISNSGKNKDVLQIVEEANHHHFITIGLTQLGKTKLGKAVEHVILTSRTDNINNGHYGSGATHSLLLQLLTIDIIYFFYLKYNKIGLVE
ncbi:MurR/RpiR family transcriptional regulator [Enterococcus hirae]|nr:MurR/RpiR family transcriptional regulator [Enterococcus hirae]